MLVDYYVTKNWVLSLTREMSNAHQFLHMAKNHIGLTRSQLLERSKEKRSDASAFCGVSAEFVTKDLVKTLFSDDENLKRVMRWVNTDTDRDDMAFIVDVGRRVGVCCHRDGSFEDCHTVVFWFRKSEVSLMPRLCTVHPVPEDYYVPTGRSSERYATVA